MTDHRAAAPAADTRRSGAAVRRGPGGRRPVPFGVAALLWGITAAALVLVALLAGRSGPLVAHPHTVAPPPPRPVTMSHPPLPSMPTALPKQTGPQSVAWLWWVAAVIGLLLLILLGIWLARVLRRPHRIAPPRRPPRWPALWRG